MGDADRLGLCGEVGPRAGVVDAIPIIVGPDAASTGLHPSLKVGGFLRRERWFRVADAVRADPGKDGRGDLDRRGPQRLQVSQGADGVAVAAQIARRFPERLRHFVQIANHVIGAHRAFPIPTFGRRGVIERQGIIHAERHAKVIGSLMEPGTGMSGADFRGARVGQVGVGVIAVALGCLPYAVHGCEERRVLGELLLPERRV